jgi:gallate dioxygenase
MEFLNLIETDPEKLIKMSIADYARLGGCEGSGIVMWR